MASELGMSIRGSRIRILGAKRRGSLHLPWRVRLRPSLVVPCANPDNEALRNVRIDPAEFRFLTIRGYVSSGSIRRSSDCCQKVAHCSGHHSRFFTHISIFAMSFPVPSEADLRASYIGEANNALLANANSFLRDDAVARILDLARYDASLAGIRGDAVRIREWLQVRTLRSVSTHRDFRSRNADVRF